MKKTMPKYLGFIQFWKTNRYRRNKKFKEQEEKPKKILWPRNQVPSFGVRQPLV